MAKQPSTIEYMAQRLVDKWATWIYGQKRRIERERAAQDPEIIDGKIGPRTMRAIRKVLADDAERKIVAACIDSGHFDSIDEIRALLDHVKAGAADAVLDDIERGNNGKE